MIPTYNKITSIEDNVSSGKSILASKLGIAASSTWHEFSTAIDNTRTSYYNSGYSAGSTAGYNSGYTAGNNAGYTAGYNKGKSEGDSRVQASAVNLLSQLGYSRVTASTPYQQYYGSYYNYTIYNLGPTNVYSSDFVNNFSIGPGEFGFASELGYLYASGDGTVDYMYYRYPK